MDHHKISNRDIGSLRRLVSLNTVQDINRRRHELYFREFSVGCFHGDRRIAHPSDRSEDVYFVPVPKGQRRQRQQ
jgi:hypothetical protein